MNPKVKQVMRRRPRTCSPEDSLSVAAEAMWRYNCGILPVVEAGGGLAGVVTDRDVCLTVGSGDRSPAETRVGDVMSRDVAVCAPGDEVTSALNTMARRRVHRLPVVAEDGALAGIVSITDVVRGPDALVRPICDDLLATLRTVGEPPWEWEEAVLRQQEGGGDRREVSREMPDVGLPIEDREAAARMLAERLERHRGRRPLVLGIPRGGVPMARLIAEALGGGVDLALVQPVTLPGRPDQIAGSVSEQGHAYLTASAHAPGVDPGELRRRVLEAMETLAAWRRWYTPEQGPADPSGRDVIVVDDGMLTPSGMVSALRAVRAGRPARVTVAVGILPRSVIAGLRGLADEIVALAVPDRLETIADAYESYPPLTDDEVCGVLGVPRGASAGAPAC